MKPDRAAIPESFSPSLVAMAMMTALVTALSAAPARAAGDDPARELLDDALRMAQAAVTSVGGVLRDVEVDGLLPAPADERLVKDAPYCADAVHETVQWLADGAGGAPNRIVRRQTTRLCRDGEGRTRQEVERDGRRVVYLRDPVAREAWTLDPERRTARRSGERTAGAGGIESAWREYSERMREWARAMAERARAAAHGGSRAEATGEAGAPPAPAGPTQALPPMPPVPVPPTPAVVIRNEGGVQVLRLDSRGGFDAPPSPPQVRWRTQALAPRGPGVVTALPAREIEGLRVNGERTTWTIEAGQLGNEKPIQIVREVWTSPELMLTVATRDFDPRSGEVSYRLANVRRGEPEASLMRVPTDYQRVERGERAAPRASAPRG